MTKRSTVVDVARRAGVSASTVSRHLRGVSVKAEIASRIAQAVHELQYQPDLTARALRGGQTRTIGVLIPQVNNSFYAQAVQLVEGEAARHGCAVILLSHHESLEQQAIQLTALRRYRTDGLILAPAAGSSFEEIQAAVPGMPMVAIDRFLSPRMNSVMLRNRDAARIATEHLQHHGYRKIACVMSRPEIPSFQQRWEGYKDALYAKSRNSSPIQIQAPDHDQLRRLLCSLLQSPRRPDALLCFSNRASTTVLQAYDELSLLAQARPPMLGFDDFDLAAMVDPPLSVVRQPIDQMMRHAVAILFERIRGNPGLKPQTIALDGEMIYRRSCGCS